jgi:hypothetical protein
MNTETTPENMNTTTTTTRQTRQTEHRRRQLARMGAVWECLAYEREWAQEPRDWWGIAYLRNARNASKLAIPNPSLSISERKARFPSRIRASRTLEQWLLKIEAGENTKAARVAAALVAALDSRVGHAETPFGNFFACREREGLISYCPANRTQEITPDGKWARAGRVEIKPAKWARQILRHPELFRDDEYAAFAECFAGVEQGEKIEWRILTTEAEIDAAYNALNWGSRTPDNDDADLRISSCMWGQDVGRFYERAGARVLLGVQRGLYVSRVVLWETREIGTVADRLYASPAINEACRTYIREQGWTKKEADNNGSSGWLQPDGSVVHQTLTVEPPQSIASCQTFPYMDSFRWQYGKGLGCILSTEDHGDWDFEYSDTRGGRDDAHAGQVQDVDGNWLNEDDACSVGGDYYHSDDERIVFCERSGENIFRADAYEVDLGGRLGTRYIHEDYVSRA